MSRSALRSKLSKQAFTLVELAIAILIVSALGLSLSQYLRRNSEALLQSDRGRQIDQETDQVSNRLSRIFQDVAFLNPPCVDNPANSNSTINCSVIKVRGGITPLPAWEWSDLNAQSSFQPSANLTGDPASFENLNDAVRVIKYNFSGSSFDCSLDSSVAVNPSVSEEKLWVDSSCASLLRRNQIYMLAEQFSGVAFSTLFQVTDISGNQIGTSSAGGPINQVGGLGLSGFTSAARVFPVRLEEYALKVDDSTLLRREVLPNETSRYGFGPWEVYLAGIESIQFWPVTVVASGPIQHQRSMSFSSDAANNGVEDIRGVIPWFVSKGSSESAGSNLSTDNPFTAEVETDGLQRSQRRFFVKMMNFPN